jgi:putative transposase
MLARIILRLLADLGGLVVLYQERCAKPRRIDAATRVSPAVLSLLFDWRDALVMVRPETPIRGHRAGSPSR